MGREKTEGKDKVKYHAKTETTSEKIARWTKECEPFHSYYQNWHRWFAWYPVPVSKTHKVWLGFVERKYTWGTQVTKTVYDPIYREVKK